MGSDDGSRSRDSRRHRRRDDENERSDSRRRRRSRDRDAGRRRDRSRSAEPRRKERKRSRTPESSRRRRSRSRDRDQDRDRDNHRHREERRHRDAERDGHRRRRSPDDKELTRRRRRREDDESAASDDDRRRPSDRKRSPLHRGGPLPSQADSFAVDKGDLDEPPKPKEQPNFSHSGSLAKASNSVQQADGSTITLKYHEPPEARKPPAKDDWKLFVFKGDDVVDTVGLSARSCWLVGRETAVVDLAAEHPSISKQHAVLQFRHVEKRNEFGDRIGRVKPYLIDLESANGTELNGKKVADSRYVELRDKDVVKFGHSTREYVVMLAPRD